MLAEHKLQLLLLLLLLPLQEGKSAPPRFHIAPSQSPCVLHEVGATHSSMVALGTLSQARTAHPHSTHTTEGVPAAMIYTHT